MKATARVREPNSVSLDLGDRECRLEKVLAETGQEQIRLSLWSQGKMQRRPVSLSEQELTTLLQAAIRAGILSRDFVGSFQSITEI
jgi:hypothetical protein